MNYEYNNHLTSTNSSQLFTQKSLQCKQTNYQLMSAVAVRYTCHLRADCPPYTLLLCKDSKEIRLLHRHQYIQYIPIESNFLKKLYEKSNPLKKIQLDNKSLKLFTTSYLLIGTFIFVGISWMLVNLAFLQKVRFVFQISKCQKKIIPKNYPELEI